MEINRLVIELSMLYSSKYGSDIVKFSICKPLNLELTVLMLVTLKSFVAGMVLIVKSVKSTVF